MEIGKDIRHIGDATIYTKQRLFWLDPKFLMGFMIQGKVWRVVEDGIPDDKEARIVSSGFDGLRGMFYLIVEHPSFDNVRQYDIIPMTCPTFTKLYPGDTV